MSSLCCYIREGGPSREEVRAYAESLGQPVLAVLYDRRGEYRSFRNLQNLIKTHRCTGVLIPSYDALGEDEYLMLENLLFLKRNGVRVIRMFPCAKRTLSLDPRHRLAEAVRAFFSEGEDWAIAYGSAFPERDSRPVFSRRPPFGYEVVGGRVQLNQQDAEVVRAIFRGYADGRSIYELYNAANAEPSSRQGGFTHMTVKSMLSNERYLGRRSQKGYRLPAILYFRTWFAARERYEREYSGQKEAEPFFAPIVRGPKPVFFRQGARPVHIESPIADSDSLEQELCSMIRTLASEANADTLFDSYIVPGLNAAREALPQAQREADEAAQSLRSAANSYIEGGLETGLQAGLSALADRRVMLSMRVRRIMSEEELFSVSRGQVREFFSRARRMDELSGEERLFIASAFIDRACFAGRTLRTAYVSPRHGRFGRHDLPVKS